MEMQLPDLEFDIQQEPVAALPDLEFDTEPQAQALPDLEFDTQEYEAAPVMGESAPEDAPLDTSAAGVEMQPMTPGEYAGFVGESAVETGKGVVAATIGLPGDIESVSRGVKEIVTSPETESAWSAFQRGIQEETVLPTTEKVGEGLFGKPKEDQKVLRTAGEFLSLEGALIKGISLARRAAKAPVDKISKKDANNFIDSYQEMLNTEIATGADPVAATNAANEYFNVTDDFVAKAAEKAKRKPHYFTQQKAQEALEVAKMIADPSDPSVVSRFFETGTGRKLTAAGKFFDRGMGVISTRVKNISKPVFNRLRDLDRRSYQRIHTASVEIAPFFEDIKKISKEARPEFDLALANGDVKTIESMLVATGNPDAVNNYAKVRNLLDSLYEEADNAELNLGHVKNYFPRAVKDFEGLRASYGVEVNSELDDLLEAAAIKKGANLDNQEASDIINKYVRGYPRGIDADGPTAGRTKEYLEPEDLKFYEKPELALQSYIHRMVTTLEQRRFLGRIEVDPETGVGDYRKSIGNYIAQEKARGVVNKKNEKELKEILQARLAPGRIGDGYQVAKNYMYMGTLVDPIATITQLGDTVIAGYHNGIEPTITAVAKSVTGRADVKLNDYGFKEMTEDFSDVSKTRKALDVMFKGTLFSSVDRLGKETILNGALKKHIAEVKDPIKLTKFKKEWGETFGDDFNQLVKDLKAGDQESEHVRLLLWHRLADAQPISLSEMPQKYLEMKGGKLLYMLKTFTLKQFDIIRRDGLAKLKDPETVQEGLANLTRYAAFFTAAGMGTDELKAQILGRDVDLTDLVEENLLKIVGLSRYSLHMAEREGFIDTATSLILPPVGTFGNLIEGAYDSLVEQEFNSKLVKTLPLGDVIESRLLGGAEKYNERKQEKEIQEKREAYGFGKSKNMQERRAYYGYGTGVKDIEERRKYYGYADGGAVDEERDPLDVSLENVDMPEDRPLSEDLYRAGKTYEHMGRGAVAAAGGSLGDAESLVRGVYEGATGEGSFGEGFVRGMQEETVLPTTEDVKKYLPEVTGDEFMTDKQREVASGMGEFTGLTAPIGGSIKAAKIGTDRFKAYMSDFGPETPKKFSPDYREDLPEKFNLVKENDFVIKMREADQVSDELAMDLMTRNSQQYKDVERIRRDVLEGRELARGAEQVRIRMLQEKRAGNLDEDTVEMATWLLGENPNIADDLAVQIRQSTEYTPAGAYNSAGRIIRLYKEAGDDKTAVHELLHHSEKMMPEGIRSKIQNEWRKRLLNAVKEARKFGNDERADMLLKQVANSTSGNVATASDEIMNAYKKGILNKERDYQFTNPSEFWAVNGSDMISGKYFGRNERPTWVGKAKAFIKKMTDFAKEKVGMESDRPLNLAVQKVLEGKHITEGKMFTDQKKLKAFLDDTGFKTDKIVTGNSVDFESMKLPPAENAQRTQIIGTLPTYDKAKKMFDEQVGTEGTILDFGAGLGEGAKKMGADSYEPFPREGFNPTFSDSTEIPSESYDKITNLNVLNVVPRDVRDGIVQEIGRVLKPNGTAIITTRGKDVMKATGKKGPEENSIITSRDTYQKGFTQQELKSYIEETLGEGFTVKSIKLGPAGVMVTKAQAFAEGGLAEGNLNEEMRPEMDMPVEQPQQEVVVQAKQPQKPTIKMPEKKGREPEKHYTDEYLDRLAYIESSNNTNAYNEKSEALGLYQFVPSTWTNMVNRYMPELKQQKGDYMEFRRNPEVARFMARKLMEENQNILTKKGYKDTKGNLYLAHFAGPSTALKVLKANPNTPVKEVMTAGQIARNPGVFNKVKTAGQLVRWAQVKMALKPKK